MDPFIEKNWKTLAFIFLILLAVFVWPTLYKEMPPAEVKIAPQRQNRLTGEVKIWDGGMWKTQ